MKKSDQDFLNWILSVRPEDVEKERFGSVDIYRNRFGTQLHKESVSKHEVAKQRYKLGLSRPVEREPRRNRTPKLSKGYLAIVREEIKRMKNG